MRPDDLTVEVRDRDLQRVGQIDPDYLTGAVFSPRPNGIGSWQVALPAAVDGETYELAEALRQRGAGIVVTGPHGVILSGPTVQPDNKATTDAPEGTWTIQGVSDAVLLDDALAYPDPEAAAENQQRRSNDVRTAPAEALLRQYVAANIADQAIPSRRRGFRELLTVPGLNAAITGPNVTKSPRFQNLLELCQEIVAGTNVLFDIVQVGDRLEFRTWEAADLSGEVRMDIENDQLQSTDWGYAPVSVTLPILAGQGEGTARKIITRRSEATDSAETAWRRPIERFIDQRQTDDDEELRQKGDAALADALAGTDSLTVVPSDDLAAEYGNRWTAGALVTIVVGAEEVPARINQAVIAITKDGVLLGCVIGDADGNDLEGQVNRSLSSLRSRVSSLERNGAGDTGWIDLSSYIRAGLSGNLEGRRVGSSVELRGNVQGALPATASGHIANDLPPTFRPGGPRNAWGTFYLGGQVGSLFVRSAGFVGYAHAVNEQPGAQFSITYLAD